MVSVSWVFCANAVSPALEESGSAGSPTAVGGEPTNTGTAVTTTRPPRWASGTARVTQRACCAVHPGALSTGPEATFGPASDLAGSAAEDGVPAAANGVTRSRLTNSRRVPDPLGFV
jgi:hypothetical protein